jgi:transposase
VTFDARQRLHHMAGVDLTALEGIEESTALVVLSEIGTDMSRWPSEKHFGSWLGLAPNPKKSGGILPADRGAAGAGEGHHGHGIQTGTDHIRAVEAWDSIRHPGLGGV